MIKKILIVAFLLAVPFINKLFAGGPPPPAAGGPPCFPPPCGIPLDGGISFLIVAGIAYGGKKASDIRKKNS